MRLALLAIAALSISVASAADVYRPLGIGLGDSVYAPQWQETVKALNERGYTVIPPPKWVQCLAAPSDVDALWQACVVATVNRTLAEKQLQALTIPAPFTTAFDGQPPSGFLLSDTFEVSYGNVDAAILGTRSISQPGQKYVVIAHRLTNGAILSLNAGLVVAGTGADAQDPATIATAMMTGVAGGSATGLTIGGKAATTAEAEQAIKDFTANPGAKRTLQIQSNDPASPAYGTVLIKRHDASFEISLQFYGRKLGQDGQTRTERGKRFETETKALVDQELARQAPKKLSTAGF
jgi:hypothetical protein